VIQAIATICRHVQIFEAVVVEVAYRYSHAVSNALESGAVRDILKGAILFLVIEAIPILGAGLLRDGSLGSGITEGCAVDEEDVEEAVVVIVEDRDA
jgi:hypothetical protein